MTNIFEYRKIIFIVCAGFCLTPFIDPPLALLLGFIIAQTIGNPFAIASQKTVGWLLKASVVGLGFGMNLHQALEAGKQGIIFTIFSIVFTLGLGYLLGKWLKVESKTAYLISGGTAICGGSAIAALSPIINANSKQMSVALGAIFILNSIALFVFPVIGHWLALSEHQFGVWCAIAIHDTSSVVGAATKYGNEALQVATTIKLERALWIIPLSLVTAVVSRGENKKMYLPYFIGLYVIAMCIASYFPQFKDVYNVLVLLAKKGLTLTLFLIGAGLSLSNLRSVGMKPLVQAVLLWLLISIVSVLCILYVI